MLLVLAATEAAAMYTPNPAARWKANRFFLAGDFQYTGDKDLDPAGEIEDEVGLFVRPSYSFAPNAVIYGRLGFQDADDVDTGFAIGAGVQAAWEIPAAPDWAIGGSLDYLYWDTESNGGADIDYQEIQFAPAVSYNIPQVPELTPYGGIALDFLVDDLEEDDPVGLFFGTNVDFTDRIRVDAQFRVIHENGLLISAGYLF
jgi:hypothetical protein